MRAEGSEERDLLSDSSDSRFARSYRLKSRRLINALFAEGHRYRTEYITFVYLHKKPDTQFLISVKKKYGNSPQRNHVKRLCREFFRTSDLKKNRGLQLAAVINPGKHLVSPDIRKAFSEFSLHISDEISLQI